MTDFRAQFPVLERLAYLNAGTDGPLPRAAEQAALEAVRAQAAEGRFTSHFMARLSGQAALRAGYARLVGAGEHEVALTSSTSEGLSKAITGLGLRAGDEILTSGQEHPGLIGPLVAARARGVAVRAAPLTELASHVTARTSLVACSHVSWISGLRADPALAEIDVPVVLDGAQGGGAVDVDVKALNCAAYAGSGQKWLCGADGTGFLYVSPALQERLQPIAPGYLAFASTAGGLDAPLHTDARVHDAGSLPREGVAASLAALELLEEHDLPALQAHAHALAEALASRLRAADRVLAPRGSGSLVAWEEPEPTAARTRLAEQGVVVRDLPGTPYLRASVGAWNDESDLDRLVGALAG
jgi:L-cysteine/cystine lyase